MKACGGWNETVSDMRFYREVTGEMKGFREQRTPRGCYLLSGQDSDSQQPIENVHYCSQTKAEFITLNI